MDRLRLEGYPWNHKRLWRVYCGLLLNLPRQTKKRLPVRSRQPLVVLPHPNVVWALDFMSDALYGGRRFRTLNILDEGVCEGLAIEVDTYLPAARVIRVLEQVISWRGAPQAFRLDKAPNSWPSGFSTGVPSEPLHCATFNQGAPLKMRSSNASIAPIEHRCSTRMGLSH